MSEEEPENEDTTVVIRLVPTEAEDKRFSRRKRRKWRQQKLASSRSIYVGEDQDFGEYYYDDIERQGFSGFGSGSGPVFHHHHGGGAGAVVLAVVPILLIAGVALGYLVRQNAQEDNDLVSGRVNNTNFIFINGSTINNQFTGNNDQDNQNTNNNNQPKKRSIDAFEHNLMRVLGVADANTLALSFVNAVKINMAPTLLLKQSAALARRASCAATDKNATDVCVKRVLCEHLAEDHLVYGGNLFLHMAQSWTAAIATGIDILEVPDVAEAAVLWRCDDEYGDCDIQRIEKCLNVY